MTLPTPSACLNLFALAGLAIALASPLNAAEKDKTREQDKLKPKPVEESSLQTLTSVYTECVNRTLIAALAEEKGQLTHGDIESACKEERTNLKIKASNQFIGVIDDKFLNAYNHEVSLNQ